MKIGEDSYEEFDEGTLSYDGVGERFAFVTDPRSDSRRILKEYVCRDITKSTGVSESCGNPGTFSHRITIFVLV